MSHTLTEVLDEYLTVQNDEGLVNFNKIATHVSGIGSGIPVLLRKGGLNDVKTNLINMNEGDETRVVKKQGTQYFVDPRLAVAFIRINCKNIPEDVERWESTYGRADIPEVLSQDAPTLLRHLMSVFNSSKFRCTFQDGKWYFCLHDVVQAATEDPNIGRTLGHIKHFDNSLLVNLRQHQFFA